MLKHTLLHLTGGFLCSAGLLSAAAELKTAKPIIHKVASVSSPQNAYSGSHTIKQAIDGSTASPNWHIPQCRLVEGVFTFDTPVTLDGLRFVSPSFGRVAIEAKIDGRYKKLGSFNPNQVRFAKSLKGVESIRLSIGSKAAGAAQFSFSLRELEFYQRGKAPYGKLLARVFTDSSLSQLREGVSEADIAELPQLLQKIAKALKEGRYPDKAFRIAKYKAYSTPELARETRVIKALNPFDNPTGIYAQEGDEIYVFVGPTKGQFVSLISNRPTSLHTSTYPLEQGINKVKIDCTGLLYIGYNSDKLGKKPQAISIQIPPGSGKVNGYFDIAKHDDADWKRLLKKATFEVFDVVGKKSMMILTTEWLKAHSPDAITTSVRIWDDSSRAIWRIMGFEGKNDGVNNRMLGFSTNGGAHMFSTEYGCGYSNGPKGYNMKNEILYPGVAQGNRIWGIGHEVGHSHQHAFDWPSMRESSNNFFAQLLLDQVMPKYNGGKIVSDMENPCKYLLEDICKGKPFHNINGWAQWGFAQYSFYLYFHKLGINPQFYPELFESLRKKPVNTAWADVAKVHLAWYERICNETKTDFTEDFETFNWFVPIDHKGHQYGDYVFKMTKQMADAAKARIKAKGYPKPKYRIAFMHQHAKTVNLWGLNLKGEQLNGYWTKYRDNAQLSPEVKASKQGNLIKVSQGENAAAFCVKTDGKIVGYYDRPQFDISGIKWNKSSKVYAIPIQTAQPYKLIYAEG